MMDPVTLFLQNNHLQDEDMDSLIQMATLVRETLDDHRYEDVSRVIRYTVEHGCGEAFTWCMGIIQEAFEQADCAPEDFECVLGRSIPDYDGFVARLQVDARACDNGLEKISDRNGDVEAYNNILLYRTGYGHVWFVSSENFDTRDNDFIQYKLLFRRG